MFWLCGQESTVAHNTTQKTNVVVSIVLWRFHCVMHYWPTVDIVINIFFCVLKIEGFGTLTEQVVAPIKCKGCYI